MKELAEPMCRFGVTAKEASDAFNKFAVYIPPFTEADILAIRMNPSLSWFAKRKIIRNIRKQMKG